MSWEVLNYSQLLESKEEYSGLLCKHERVWRELWPQLRGMQCPREGDTAPTQGLSALTIHRMQQYGSTVVFPTPPSLCPEQPLSISAGMIMELGLRYFRKDPHFEILLFIEEIALGQTRELNQMEPSHHSVGAHRCQREKESGTDFCWNCMIHRGPRTVVIDGADQSKAVHS